MLLLLLQFLIFFDALIIYVSTLILPVLNLVIARIQRQYFTPSKHSAIFWLTDIVHTPGGIVLELKGYYPFPQNNNMERVRTHFLPQGLLKQVTLNSCKTLATTLCILLTLVHSTVLCKGCVRKWKLFNSCLLYSVAKQIYLSVENEIVFRLFAATLSKILQQLGQ